MARNNDKINCPTNLTSPRLYALLLNAVEERGTVKSEDARKTIFPNARASAYKFNSDNNDTHGESTLALYGLIEYVAENEFRVSHLGKRLMEVFEKGSNGKYNVKAGSEYSFNSVMIDCLCGWKDSSGDSLIFPGMLLLKIISDSRLGGFIEERDWAYVCSESSYRNDADYEKLVQDLAKFRNSEDDVAITNTYAFLVAFSGDWNLFDRITVDSKNRWTLKEITSQNLKTRIRDYDLLVNSNHSLLEKDKKDEECEENHSKKRIIKPFMIPDTMNIYDSTTDINVQVDLVRSQGIEIGDKVLFVDEAIKRLRAYSVFGINAMIKNNTEYDIEIAKANRVNKDKESFLIQQMKEEQDA